MFSGTRQAAKSKIHASRDRASREVALDVLLERYLSWREECDAVRVAYQRWGRAGGAQRESAYADFIAALNREEHAARIYARQHGWVERIFA
jgi:hypothetical protein